MAVQFDGGVVLGADSRTSTGSYVANRVSDKIVPIHDYVWSCRSGSAADTQAVVDYVKHYVDAHRYAAKEPIHSTPKIFHRTILSSHNSQTDYLSSIEMTFPDLGIRI